MTFACDMCECTADVADVDGDRPPLGWLWATLTATVVGGKTAEQKQLLCQPCARLVLETHGIPLSVDDVKERV